jgi:hypothetical protein
VDSAHGIAEGLRPYFDSMDELAPVYLGRSGLHEIHLRLLWAHRLENALPAPYWQQQHGTMSARTSIRALSD